MDWLESLRRWFSLPRTATDATPSSNLPSAFAGRNRARDVQDPNGTRIDPLVFGLVITDAILILFATAVAAQPIAIFATGLAAFAVNAIVGLLFAIPKRVTTTADQVPAGAQNVPRIGIVANTSLEEVSDWLTKTIVGVGLVSWPSLLQSLDHSGRFVGEALLTRDGSRACAGAARVDEDGALACSGAFWLGQGADAGLTGGVALLVASAALGALAGYLWFARHLPGEMIAGDIDAQNFLKSNLVASGLAQTSTPIAPDEPSLPPPPPPTPPSPSPPPPVTEGGTDDGSGPTKGPPAGTDTLVGELPSPQTEGFEPKDAPAAEGVEPPLADSTQTEAASATIAAAAQLRQAAEMKYAQLRSAPLHPDDWVKGMFGGLTSVTNSFGTRSLSAQVSGDHSGWYEVTFEVQAAPRPDNAAIFILHNTFPNTTPTVAFDPAGVARLRIAAHGAFTVGALVDDGTTELELDLASLSSAPREFREA